MVLPAVRSRLSFVPSVRLPATHLIHSSSEVMGIGTALGAPLAALLLLVPPPNANAMIVSSIPRRVPRLQGLQRLTAATSSIPFTCRRHLPPHQHRHRRASSASPVAASHASQITSPLSSLASEWTTIDWKSELHDKKSDVDGENSASYEVATFSDLLPTPSPQQPSPVERLLVRDRLVYVKRDDLLRLANSNVSGNKARKFLSLNELAADNFPDVVVSYGGPQSNAMLALAAIVHSKNTNVDDDIAKKKRFVYYTKKLPRYLRQQPSGNFLRATSLGMELVELPPWKYDELFGGESGGSATPPPELEPPTLAIDNDVEAAGDDAPLSCLWVPQGGACGVACSGARVQAEEIVEFWHQNGKGLPLAVCLPGGTCTTALLLHREMKEILHRRRQNHEAPLDIQVVVIPCVGGDEYAQRQMSSLDMALGGDGKDLPSILKPIPPQAKGQSYKGKRNENSYKGTDRKPKGYYRFGNPNIDILDTYNEMKEEYGMLFDLLYGAPAWTILLQHWSDETAQSGHEDESPVAGRQIMYVHSGGLEGISSQMTRYKHKGLVDPNSIQ